MPGARLFVGISPLLLGVLALGFLAGCSKEDRYKEAFMSQCAMAQAMREACACSYDRMTAHVSIAEIALVIERHEDNPQVKQAVREALAYCTAKYR